MYNKQQQILLYINLCSIIAVNLYESTNGMHVTSFCMCTGMCNLLFCTMKKLRLSLPE